MLITISGPPGAGTTTASKLVAAALSLERVPGGEVFRALADEHGMSLAEFGRYAQANHEIDLELDRRLLEHARQGHCVIESRLAGWIATIQELDAIRCWIDCDERVRAQRVAAREGLPVEQALADNRSRAALERARYLEIYEIDLDDLSIYDLRLDSHELRPDELAARIVTAAGSRW